MIFSWSVTDDDALKPFPQGWVCQPQKHPEFWHLSCPLSSRQSRHQAGSWRWSWVCWSGYVKIRILALLVLNWQKWNKLNDLECFWHWFQGCWGDDCPGIAIHRYGHLLHWSLLSKSFFTITKTTKRSPSPSPRPQKDDQDQWIFQTEPVPLSSASIPHPKPKIEHYFVSSLENKKSHLKKLVVEQSGSLQPLPIESLHCGNYYLKRTIQEWFFIKKQWNRDVRFCWNRTRIQTDNEGWWFWLLLSPPCTLTLQTVTTQKTHWMWAQGGKVGVKVQHNFSSCPHIEHIIYIY